MSENTGIEDDQLPEDLQPSEDNPLAEPLDAGETAGDVGPGGLLDEGKPADQWDEESGDSGQGDGQGDDQGDDAAER